MNLSLNKTAQAPPNLGGLLNSKPFDCCSEGCSQVSHTMEGRKFMEQNVSTLYEKSDQISLHLFFAYRQLHKIV